MKNEETAVVTASSADTGVQTPKHTRATFDFTAEMPNVETLPKAKPSNLSISASYHEFVQGEEIRAVYMGIMPYTFLSQHSKEMETIDVAVFVTENRQIRFNGAVKFRSALERLPANTPFMAVMTGIKPKNGKNIQQFDIFLLNTEV